MANLTFLRFLLTLSVSVMDLFFKIKDAKVDRVYKRQVVAVTYASPKPEISANKSRAPSRLSPYEPGRRPRWRRSIPLSGPVGAQAGARGFYFYHQQPWQSRDSNQRAQGPTSSERYVEHSARSGLPKIDAYMRHYYQFSYWANWYLLIKNILVCLFRHEALAKWRYLDCFILGRFIVNGRVIEVASYCGCFLLITRIIWRFTMMRSGPEFRVPFVEFLLVRHEHEPFWCRGGPAGGGYSGFVASRKPGHLAQEQFYSSLLEFWNPFETHAEDGSPLSRPHKLRPNRTREAWDSLARLAARYYYIFLVIWVAIVCIFYRMGLPVVMTQRGFNYSYRHCIQWIIGQRRGSGALSKQVEAHGATNSSALAERIYGLFLDQHEDLASPLWSFLLAPSLANVSPSRLNYGKPFIIQDVFMPFSNLVNLSSSFHLVRMALEVLETTLVYTEAGLYFNSAYFLAFMMSHDISLYCRAINRRLEGLIEHLRQASSSALRARRSQHYDLLYSGRNTGRYGQAIRREMLVHEMKFVAQRAETSEIQAMIADLFVTIDSYNQYICLQSMCLIVAWLGYSALVSSWIFLPGNESPKTEWYIIHLCTTIYVFIILASMSEVKTSCRRLYNLITVAMALDENFQGSKSVWVSLMKFYSPRPLYCFTLLGSVEITYMLGLKLLVWLFSALIVASSFFQVYNIK